MAVTVNDQILALSIRRQVDMSRFSNGLVRQIIGLLNDSEADLLATIIKRGARQDSFTAVRLRALLAEVGKMNAEAYALAYKEIIPSLEEFALHESSGTSEMLQRSIPVKWDIVTPNVEQLAVLVSDAPIQGILLKDWWASLESSMATKTTQQIRLGVVAGESISQITRRLTGSAKNYESGIFSIVRRQTAAVVQTAVNHVANQAAAATYKANADIIKGEMWVATLDTHTCSVCGANDGQVFDLGTSTRPPIHVNDRCFMVPVLKSFKELGINLSEIPESTRASMNGQVPASTTYNQWLKGQDLATQQDILGVTKGKLFREGGLSIDAFSNNKGEVLTIPQLKERQGAAFKKAFG